MTERTTTRPAKTETKIKKNMIIKQAISNKQAKQQGKFITNVQREIF